MTANYAINTDFSYYDTDGILPYGWTADCETSVSDSYLTMKKGYVQTAALHKVERTAVAETDFILPENDTEIAVVLFGGEVETARFYSRDGGFYLNNSLVLSVFAASTLVEKVGGNDAMREMLDYLEEQVKLLGFDGMIYLSCHSDVSTASGFDAFHAYNWGSDGYMRSVNINNNEVQKARITRKYPQNIRLLLSTDRLREPIDNKKNFIYINGEKTSLSLKCDITASDKRLYSFEPKLMVDQLLKVYYTWDFDTKTLTISSTEHTLVYSVGSDQYTLDGEARALGYTMYLKDGLPMLSYEQVAADLGYGFAYVDEVPSITVP